jgi:hypothetical protein
MLTICKTYLSWPGRVEHIIWPQYILDQNKIRKFNKIIYIFQTAYVESVKIHLILFSYKIHRFQ